MRLGDVVVRKLADVLGGDHVDDIDAVLLRIQGTLDAGAQAGDDDDLARLVLGRRRASSAFVDRFIVPGGGVTRESWSGPNKRDRRADKKRESPRPLKIASSA